jgi:hypothetical protein
MCDLAGLAEERDGTTTLTGHRSAWLREAFEVLYFILDYIVSYISVRPHLLSLIGASQQPILQISCRDAWNGLSYHNR